jgi:probable F420-dependent oxidoreductase
MKLDTFLTTADLAAMPALSAAAEVAGFDGIWTAETAHNPFLPLTLAAEHTRRMALGTAIAVAFPRSPTVLAHLAWDLHRYSEGRFVLGLGTQVKAHIVMRFGARWEKPVRQMRETVEAIRAVWQSWQTGNSLNYRGEYFTLRLMTPFFAPPPLTTGLPPIYIAAVNEQMLRLAGERCDGVHIHPFHSAKYLKEYAWPHLLEGMQASGRADSDFTTVAAVFTIPTDGIKPAAEYEREVKEQIAFYMSTPSYRSMVDLHGWTATAEQLSAMARRGEWQAMGRLITDEMLDAYAVTGAWSQLGRRLRRRYAGGLLDRVAAYQPYDPAGDPAGWSALLQGWKESASE